MVYPLIKTVYNVKIKYQLTAANKIDTELKSAFIRPNPPLKPTRQPIINGAIVKLSVIKIQIIYPIVTIIIYSPIHYTDIQAVDGVYL
jgi:hypothetical protein